ncbi:MAG: Mg chelatase, subunit ChlI [Candidatus Uhrbacteria bacterium GW2011_GWE2_40_58]|nr:MAG: Mg chelatase, subunit ChlI [Candidatus Uhrbacteria bacterium GW2011_GWF2_40_263]KKR67448.1 MAG: Mg chelatase, subunit ChlI [Candidatus Uhrbacteria bacterium GW2011_GWE2_40_58]OGL94455.1 MAG: hypothetical protein A2239_01185 [Candidatus Uhrbacteria bacterium RIFOXYA2_FULL_40_9]OGL98287.1 MAG: hypothetical protein A2332_05020 [Candidatus Uhrbacteria bacterium RIFOXYB2_FULL_41_18]HCB55699.1 hypothetical protein [Candidatus Uhrbacteria bacterium]
MKSNTITTVTLFGIEAMPVLVETDISYGLTAFHLVGLPDASVKEARDRIRAAIKNSRLPFPRTRITTNLAPANTKKQGALYDLPIALSILLAEGEITQDVFSDAVFIGELALDGTLRPISGALAAALMVKREGKKDLFLPKENEAEVNCVPGINIYSASTLHEVVEHLKGLHQLSVCPLCTPSTKESTYSIELQHIKGQEQAKRGLEIAASGGHNLLLKGPPGTGKTLLARALPSILPTLSYEESLEVTSIASVAGILKREDGLLSLRPFRDPHHSSSAISLVGGGTWPKPGEVSLAHRGVLFLDELPEFSRHVLEHLRQPLEDGEVTISRIASTVRFPASFLLVAAMNPCPCGYYQDPKHECTCSQSMINRYKKRISGPLLDRFDLIIDVPAIETEKLLKQDTLESSLEVRLRVKNAREKQNERYQNTSFLTNAEIPVSSFDTWCQIDREGKQLLEQALRNQHLSARGYSRVCKVARTIADLESAEQLSVSHIAEALQYRLRDI